MGTCAQEHPGSNWDRGAGGGDMRRALLGQLELAALDPAEAGLVALRGDLADDRGVQATGGLAFSADGATGKVFAQSPRIGRPFAGRPACKLVGRQ